MATLQTETEKSFYNVLIKERNFTKALDKTKQFWHKAS